MGDGNENQDGPEAEDAGPEAEDAGPEPGQMGLHEASACACPPRAEESTSGGSEPPAGCSGGGPMDRYGP